MTCIGEYSGFVNLSFSKKTWVHILVVSSATRNYYFSACELPIKVPNLPVEISVWINNNNSSLNSKAVGNWIIICLKQSRYYVNTGDF